MTKKEWQDLLQNWVANPFTSKLPNTRERHRTPWFNTKNRRWYLWNEGLKKLDAVQNTFAIRSETERLIYVRDSDSSE